eukprot:bmy_12404T0
MTSVPEGLLAGKGQESADAYPASGQFQVPLTMCLEEQRCEGLSGFGNVLFNSVSCGDLRQNPQGLGFLTSPGAPGSWIHRPLLLLPLLVLPSAPCFPARTPGPSEPEAPLVARSRLRVLPQTESRRSTSEAASTGTAGRCSSSISSSELISDRKVLASRVPVGLSSGPGALPNVWKVLGSSEVAASGENTLSR